MKYIKATFVLYLDLRSLKLKSNKKSILYLFIAFILIGCSGIEEKNSEYTITLLGDSIVFLNLDDDYQDLGAICIENGILECEVTVSGDKVDPTTIGEYKVMYYSPNNLIHKERVVVVLPKKESSFIITIIGSNEIFLTLGEKYQEMGAICIENGILECEVKITGDVVDINSPGTYTLKYSSPNELVYKIKTITILDVTPPIISVTSNKLVLRQAFDLYDYINVTDDSGEILDFEVISNNVDIDKVGTYVITISAIDSSGNSTTEDFNFFVEREFLTALSQSWVNIYTLNYYFNSNLVRDRYQASFKFETKSDFYVTNFTLQLKVTYQYRTSSGSLLYKTEYLSFSQLGQTRTINFPQQGNTGSFTYEIFTITGNVYKN
jgi:hypothetical protein